MRLFRYFKKKRLYKHATNIAEYRRLIRFAEYYYFLICHHNRKYPERLLKQSTSDAILISYWRMYIKIEEDLAND